MEVTRLCRFGNARHCARQILKRLQRVDLGVEAGHAAVQRGTR